MSIIASLAAGIQYILLVLPAVFVMYQIAIGYLFEGEWKIGSLGLGLYISGVGLFLGEAVGTLRTNGVEDGNTTAALFVVCVILALLGPFTRPREEAAVSGWREMCRSARHYSVQLGLWAYVFCAVLCLDLSSIVAT